MTIVCFGELVSYARRAGAICEDTFLDRFSCHRGSELRPGRVWKLEARGRHGSMDSFVVHLHPHSKEYRCRSLDIISGSLSSKDEVLKVLFCDLNVVSDDHGRHSPSLGQLAGSRNSGDASCFQRVLAQGWLRGGQT